MKGVSVQIKREALRLTLQVAIKNLEADREKCHKVLDYMALHVRIRPVFGLKYQPIKEGNLGYKNDIYINIIEKYNRLLELCNDVSLDTISMSITDYEFITGWRDKKLTYIRIVYLDWVKVKIKNACMFATYPSFETISQEFAINKLN